jgi:glycosyltransferase involved in cell wall biosynthesis
MRVRPSRLRLVSPLPPGRRPSLALGWLARRCGSIVVDGAAEAESLRILGVDEKRLHVVAPGVEPTVPAEPARLPGLPDDAQVMLVVGPIARHKGQREAVWTFDILAFLGERLHLVIVSDGPDMEGVRRFSEVTGREKRTHFVGPVADLSPWLARADVVLAAGTGGRMTILEAMAAGRPVVATPSADRMDLLEHGRTGLFGKRKDIPDLGRQVKTILENGDLARTLGTNARAEVVKRFGVAAFVEAMQNV